MNDPGVPRKWIGRLTFTFLAIAFLFGWNAYQHYLADGNSLNDWRTILDCLAVVFFVALAMLGLRDRHTPR